MLAFGDGKAFVPTMISKPKLGRPLIGTAKRVRLFASVAAETDAQIARWRTEAEAGARNGQVIDRLVAHGLASSWSPAKPQTP